MKNILDAQDSGTSLDISTLVSDMTVNFTFNRFGFDISSIFVAVMGYTISASGVSSSYISFRFDSSYSYELRVVAIFLI